jgi:uncharacterized protein with HEPN domain
MPPEKDDTAYLWDMRIAAREAMSFVAGRDFDAFVADGVLIHALEREFEIIGKAARRISDAYRSSHPEIPWRGIIGLRNVIAHDYSDVDLTSLWKTLREDLPALLETLERLLEPDT